MKHFVCTCYPKVGYGHTQPLFSSALLLNVDHYFVIDPTFMLQLQI